MVEDNDYRQELMSNLTEEQMAWLQSPHFGRATPPPPSPAQSSGPTVPMPPEGVLRRKGDGGLFWEPNPDPAAKSQAPDPWVNGFLRYYDLAPPADDAAGSSGACIFNSAPTTVDKVVATLSAQAPLASYKPSSNAKSIVLKVLATRGAGQKKGANLAEDIKSGATSGLDQSLADFEKMDMPSLLDALEKLRDARQLERLALMDLKTKPRLAVAILSVKRQLDDNWTKLAKQLSDPDKAAITHHVYGRLIADEGDDDESGKKEAQDFCATINETLKKKGDVAPLRAKLLKLDMHAVLAVLTKLKQAGTLEDFVDALSSGIPDRIGAAVLTVRQDFGTQWQCVVAKLGGLDQQAILELAPADKQPDSSVCPGGDKKKDDDGSGWQKQVAGGLQYAGHWTIKNAKLTPNDPAHDWTAQVQVGANYAGHKDHASGPEFQALVQIGYNISTGQVSVLGGLQGTLEKTIWIKGVETQLQGTLQALGGGLSDPGVVSTVHGQFQAQIGVAYLVNLGPVWIGLQASGGITLTQGSPMDFPGALTIGFQKSF